MASRVFHRLEELGCGALVLKEGTLYPVLYRLEEAGLVRGQWEDDSQGRRGPRRRIYRLTEKGKRGPGAAREDWTQFVAIVGRILGAPA